MQEKENILRILQETKEAIKKEDIIKLKELSNQTIHTASITQDPDNIAIAVIVYSLSKIIERGQHKKTESFCKNVLISIDKAISSLEKNDSEKLKEDLGTIRIAINKCSKNLKEYIQDVFRKASINKASKIYEHGISMEKTAHLLGITMFELAGYAGQKEIKDVPETETLNVKSRIKLAMEMFR